MKTRNLQRRISKYGFQNTRLTVNLAGRRLESVQIYYLGPDSIAFSLRPTAKTFAELRQVAEARGLWSRDSLVLCALELNNVPADTSVYRTAHFSFFSPTLLIALAAAFLVIGLGLVFFINWPGDSPFWATLIKCVLVLWGYLVPATGFILLLVFWVAPTAPQRLVIESGCVIAAIFWSAYIRRQRDDAALRVGAAIERKLKQLEAARESLANRALVPAEPDDIGRRDTRLALLDLDITHCKDAASALDRYAGDHTIRALDWIRGSFVFWAVLQGSQNLALAIVNVGLPDPGAGATLLTAIMCGVLVAGEYGRMQRLRELMRRLQTPDYGQALWRSLRLQMPRKGMPS